MTICVAVPAPAAAQDEGRAFAGAVGGAAFGDSQTSGLFEARAGVRLSGGWSILGEVGRIQNLLPSDVQDSLDVIARLDALQGGPNATLDGRLAATYFSGAGRWSWSSGRWSPFAEGGGGLARLRLSVGGTDSSASDVESELRTDTPELNANHPMLSAGGGVTFRGGRWSADAGYRYLRFFVPESSIHSNVVYAGLNWWF